MDGREGMTLSGSQPYYLHSAIGGVGVGGSGGATHTVFNSPTAFRSLPNPTLHQVQSNFGGLNSVGHLAFNVDGSPAAFVPHGYAVTVPASASTSVPGAGGGVSGGGSSNGNEPSLKKKRGRPRKYAPDGSGVGSASGTVSLGLSPLSSTPNSNTPAAKRKRGRPPGSGRKQRLASVGEWMSTSAGVAFTPHVIYIDPGEDIASKILTFSQQRPRALCIMSASGSVSAVTLRQPASSVGNATFEGQFEILCLSGSYLVAETGGARNRTGGVNISLSNQDGQVIGGSVAGRLIASRPSQVVVCSFVYGTQKPPSPKAKSDSDSKGGKNSSGDNTTEPPVNASHSQQMTPADVGWPASNPLDERNPRTDIDLMS